VNDNVGNVTFVVAGVLSMSNGPKAIIGDFVIRILYVVCWDRYYMWCVGIVCIYFD
jgi:hypothetical protein